MFGIVVAMRKWYAKEFKKTENNNNIFINSLGTKDAFFQDWKKNI